MWVKKGLAICEALTIEPALSCLTAQAFTIAPCKWPLNFSYHILVKCGGYVRLWLLVVMDYTLSTYGVLKEDVAVYI